MPLADVYPRQHHTYALNYTSTFIIVDLMTYWTHSSFFFSFSNATSVIEDKHKLKAFTTITRFNGL